MPITLPERRSERLFIRLSPATLDDLRRAAAAMDAPLATTARALIVAALRQELSDA